MNENLRRVAITSLALVGFALVAAVLLALVSLAGAVVGGSAGMRFHRRVDRAGLDI